MFDSKCNLFAENHLIFTQNVLLKAKKLEKEITIEGDCWIGSNATILDGLKIERGFVIGTGMLATKDILADSVVDKRDKNIKIDS